MSIIHSLIARYPDVVLVEHSEYSGNFLQISRLVLQNIKSESAVSIIYDQYLNILNFRHKFHYINSNKITYLCLSEGMDDETVFAFLNDIKKKLLQNYDFEKLSTYAAFQLNEFTETLRNYIVHLKLILELLQ